MPIFLATARASSTSRREQQPLDFSSRHSPLDQVLIVTPITSWPRCLRSQAHTELSTPPDMATTTLPLFSLFMFKTGKSGILVIVFFGLVVLGVAEGFFEFTYSFPEAFADLGQPVGAKKEQAHQKDDQKLWKSYAKHTHLTFF